MKAWIFLCWAAFAIACGGTSSDGVSRTSDDGGPGSGGASSGGSSNGGASAGGIATAGTSGTGGVAGSGAAGGINCSNVGCGPPPRCDVGCQEPCGCCPCADGSVQVIGGQKYVCGGGCYAPVAPPVDAGGQIGRA